MRMNITILYGIVPPNRVCVTRITRMTGIQFGLQSGVECDGCVHNVQHDGLSCTPAILRDLVLETEFCMVARIPILHRISKDGV